MPECLKCDGSGFQMVEREERGRVYRFARRCECLTGPLDEAGASNALLVAGVPDAYAWYTQDGWRSRLPELEQFLGSWPEHLGYLVISGPSGVGKTGIAIPILREALRRRERGRYLHFPLWYTEVLDAYGDSELNRARVSDLKFPGVLVIDDFLRGIRPQQLENQQTFQKVASVLDYRYCYRKPTILIIETASTGQGRHFTAQGCVRALDGALERRLFGDGSFHLRMEKR